MESSGAAAVISLATQPPAFYDKNPGLKIVSESLYVGSRLICTHDEIHHNQGEAHISHTAYCCPKCGQIWGRRVLALECEWQFVVRPCEEHGGGSLVFSDYEWEHLLDDYYASYYPLPWLAYELFLLVRKSNV